MLCCELGGCTRRDLNGALIAVVKCGSGRGDVGKHG